MYIPVLVQFSCTHILLYIHKHFFIGFFFFTDFEPVSCCFYCNCQDIVECAPFWSQQIQNKENPKPYLHSFLYKLYISFCVYLHLIETVS